MIAVRLLKVERAGIVINYSLFAGSVVLLCSGVPVMVILQGIDGIIILREIVLGGVQYHKVFASVVKHRNKEFQFASEELHKCVRITDRMNAKTPAVSKP